MVHQRSRKKPAAGQNRSGGAELLAEFTEERGALLEEAHPESLSLCRSETEPTRQRQRRVRIAGNFVLLSLFDPTDSHSSRVPPKGTKKTHPTFIFPARTDSERLIPAARREY